MLCHARKLNYKRHKKQTAKFVFDPKNSAHNNKVAVLEGCLSVMHGSTGLIIMYLLRVVHSPLESMYSPGWHSQVILPEAATTVLMLSGQAQA